MTLPFLTADVPGCGGLVKATPEDFEVDEIPAYEASGEAGAEHLFLWVEKRQLATPEVASLLAKALHIGERDISWAGLKDRQGVTRQYLCVPAKCEAAIPSLAIPGLTVLRAARHRNKLKVGHLRGNRFSIVLRDVKDLGAAKAALAQLEQRGVPNFFGQQRFGRGGDNAERGKALLLSKSARVPRFERKLFLSAYQSSLFNTVLSRRLTDGLFSKVLSGDVLKKHETNGEFVYEAPEVDQPRSDSFEVSATGPMFGPSMREATGAVGDAERAVLDAEGLTLESFAAGGRDTEGTRRFLRIPLLKPTLEPLGDGDARLRIELPAGVYATVVLRELLKRD